MQATLAHPPANAPQGSAPGALRQALARAESRRKWRAFALTLPFFVLGRRWARNVLLNKWLEYCAERGHRFDATTRCGAQPELTAIDSMR